MLSRTIRQVYTRGLLVQPRLTAAQAFPVAIRHFSSGTDEDVDADAAEPVEEVVETRRAPEPVQTQQSSSIP